MKKIFVTLLALLLVPLTVTAAKYEEGTHYKVIPGQATKKPEVREYFSYHCPACRGFEAFLPEIEKTLPKGTKLKKTHVDFMPAANSESQYMLSQGLMIANKTGLAKQYNAEAFSYLQTQRKSINSIDDVKKIYVVAGGKAEDFEKGLKSFALMSRVKRDKKIQDKLSKGRFVNSVPTFVVNGKYAINARALDNKNFIEEYKNIIAYLLTL
ncbi:thiol:disulfide interchange protein DsbA/DsbL [Thalassotalea sediminis]|uniref:thiol:disulfide interchange protein DsbA/DsbL n=1 Tax=Thalassotalea sediminis TaxID=1759089 RepID=UPI002573D9EE|nr:thiol:disulfide interchange protein DsbA/DsbL [Thalassotalea sediminis]